MMTVYEKIDRALKQHENFKYCERSLSSIANYIDWAWKWRKITKEEMENATNRICALFDAELEMSKVSEMEMAYGEYLND